MKLCLIIISILLSISMSAQKIDTIQIQSVAMKAKRLIVVVQPEFFQYQSPEFSIPVIYILDSQHEWMANPVRQIIRYLQYTHEIPQALIVLVPLANRNQECLFQLSANYKSPLLTFLTEEVENAIQQYRPAPFRLLIGHSFSASFALYANLRAENLFPAVMAHTPLYQLDSLIHIYKHKPKTIRKQVMLSTGGIAKDKDYYHRKAYNQLKKQHATIWSDWLTYEADYSAHNAVPITATPFLLSKYFERFSSRYNHIAPVNSEYKLIQQPISVRAEIEKIDNASFIGKFPYPPELPEINGIASRYLAGNLTNYAAAVYELGVRWYPKFYDFHLSLYQIYSANNKEKAKQHLLTAEHLLRTIELNLPDLQDLLNEIDAEKKKHGW